ncbi:MAG: NAD(P)H-hydrate dehydratase [Chloroflexi bacterium]|nr:NAD(P)H-hydrate dehydratase [Chloroflexota bacterium]|tara:strand:- start:9770 stop:11266 length:1497 start_codon:yes stop_codon:yes gene_type:complete
MIPILYPAEIKNIENKINLSSKRNDLQKKAVEGVVNILTRLNPSKLIVIVGAGLNGEDGLLIGSKLKNISSIEIEYFHSISAKSKSKNFNLAKKLKIDLKNINEYKISNKSDNTIILDCLLGISANLPMRSAISNNLEFINKLNSKLDAKIISLDIPSGFDPTTGLQDKNTLNASHVIFLGYQTIGTLIDPSLFTSTSHIDIGIEEKDLNELGIKYTQAIDFNFVKSIFPKRKNNLYKGQFGSHLIIGGSEQYPGAAILSSKSSNIAGTGHTSISTSSHLLEKIIKEVPEVTNFKFNLSENLDDSMSKFTSISIGVGLGINDKSKNIIDDLIYYLSNTKNKHKIILDADALNILSEIENWWQNFKIPTLITPHIGEYKKLFRVKGSEISLDSIKSISDDTNLNILLKGANTIISTPNGIQKINTLANGGMSKPGMGDVLTGTIGSLASNNSINIENAATIGVYVHSQSGLLAKEKYGATSMTASNVISFIPQVFKILE